MTAAPAGLDAPSRVKITVPPNFDPESTKHKSSILKKIADTFGDGYAIASFNADDGELILEKSSAITVFDSEGDTKLVRIGDGEETGNLQRLAEKLEDQAPGYLVVSFDLAKKPPRAKMRHHTEREAQLRKSLAVALNCHRTPWEVHVKESGGDGSVTFYVPPTYVPSKHDKGLREVAETVAGEPGWYVKVDPKTRMGRINPGELPTFPKMAPHPLNKVVQKLSTPNDTKWIDVPIGLGLHEPGDDPFTLRINNGASAHTMYQGKPGSGKSFCVNSHLWYFVAHGAELAIIDTPSKAADFAWVRPFVMEGGWGCDGIEYSLATAKIVLEKAEQRSAIINRQGVKNWTEVTGPEAFGPLLLVADEFTTLRERTDPLKSLDKDHPERRAAEANNAMGDLFGAAFQRIVLEMRFAGVFVILSTQLANGTSGVPPKLKTGFGNLIAMGSNLSENQKANALASPKDAPKVPDHILAADGVSKGVGIAELEGRGMHVFKGFFVQEADLRANLMANPNLAQPGGSAPSEELVYRHVPQDIVEDARYVRGFGSSDNDPGDRESRETAKRGRSGGGGGSEGLRLAREEGLQGAAAASYALAYDAAQAKKNQAAQQLAAAICSSCGGVLDEGANCRCS